MLTEFCYIARWLIVNILNCDLMDPKTYYEIFPFGLRYKTVMFYITGLMIALTQTSIEEHLLDTYAGKLLS